MPTKALFAFAHQDDEFGVLYQIRQHVLRGEQVRCAYLTDGATARVPAAVRNAESLRVLARLGVAAADVSFAGDVLGIGDGKLPQHLGAASQWLASWLAADPEAAVYVTAWEGGHPDHDVLHALVVDIAARQGRLARTWQFSLYNAFGLKAPWFRVLAPLPANGPVLRQQMPWAQRVGLLRHCFGYPSQAKTWLGLFPFVLLHHLRRGIQSLQPVDPARTRVRPHEGTLYYEARQFSTWERVSGQLREQLGGGSGPAP